MYPRNKFVIDPITVLLLVLGLMVLILVGVITPENAADAVRAIQELRK